MTDDRLPSRRDPTRIEDVWDHNLAAAHQVIRHLNEGHNCALLGSRYSGKTGLLRYIQQTLTQESGWMCVQIDLFSVAASTQAGFFNNLVRLMSLRISELTGLQFTVPSVENTGSQVFRHYLENCVHRLGRDLVLLIDHLEGIPNDLIQLLLTALRAAYMEQQFSEHRLVIVVCGALSLAKLTTGETSPFWGIAQQVLVGDLDQETSRNLIAGKLAQGGAMVSRDAEEALLLAAGSDPHLISLLCQRCIQIAYETASRKVTVHTVNRVAREFIREQAADYEPLREAIQLIEDDPDLLECILLLLKEHAVPLGKLPLRLSPDLDSLYLTGMVQKIRTKQESYQLRNEIYRRYLSQYFDPGRVGYMLTMAGRWDSAIDYLEASLRAGNAQSWSDLLAATVNAMYASQNVMRAAYYLARGLLAAFNISKTSIWYAYPGKNSLELLAQRDENGFSPLPPDEEIRLDEDRLEARAYQEKHTLREQDSVRCTRRAIPILSTGRDPVGVITVYEDLGSSALAGQRKRDLQLLSYLNQAARALQEISLRQEQILRLRSQDEELDQKARQLYLLHRVSTLVQTMTDLDKMLHLILTGITGHFGLRFNRAWLFLNSSPDCLVGHMAIGSLKHEDAYRSWERAGLGTFDEYVERLMVTDQLETTPIDAPVRELSIPVLVDGQDPFSCSVFQRRLIRYDDLLAFRCPPLTQFQQIFEPGEMMIVPLVLREECLGVIVVDDKFSPRKYTRTDEEMLGTFANQAAVAIANARERQQERRRRELAETLQEVSTVIGGSLDIERLLKLILAQMSRVLPFDTASIQLPIGDRSALRIIASKGFDDPESVERLVFPLTTDYPNTRVWRTRSPLYYSDIQEVFPHFADPQFHATQVHGWLGAPLLIREETIGVITLDSFTVNRYTEEHVQLATVFAGQAAVAIENANLFKQARQRGEQLTALDQIALEIARRLETRDLLRVIVVQATELVQGSGGGVYLWEAGKEDLRLEALYGIPVELEGTRISRFEGVNGQVLKTRLPYAVDNYQNWPHRLRIFDPYHITAVVAAPIMSGDRCLGTIAVHDTHPGKVFEKEAGELLHRFGKHAAIALENARAYEAEQEAKDYRDRLISSSLDGIVAADEEGWVTVFNDGAEKITGYSREDVLGRRMRIDQLYDSLEIARQIKRRLMSQEKLENHETTIQSRDGQTIPVILSATLLRNKDGYPIGSVGFFKDLRPLRKAEGELRLILDIINTVANARTLETGLGSLANRMVEAMNVTFCHIFLLDQNNHSLRAGAAYPVARPHAAVLKWEPRVGRSVSLDEIQPMNRLLAFPGPRVFRRGELAEGWDVVAHIQRTLNLQNPLDSVLIIPLKAERGVFGVCTLGEMRSWDRSPFSEERIAFANSMASQAVLLIDNMRAHEATKRRVKQLEDLRNVGNEMARSATGAPKVVLDLIARGACEVISADCAVIYPYHAELGVYDIRNIGSYNLLEPSKQFSPKLRLESKGMASVVLRNKRRLIVDDVEKGWDRNGEVDIRIDENKFLRREKVKSFIALGLYVGDEPVGALFVNFRDSHHLFDDALDTIQIFANQAAITIQQARLFQRGEKDHCAIHATHQITRLIGATDSLQPVWQAILDGALSVTGALRGQIILKDERQGWVTTAAAPSAGGLETTNIQSPHPLKCGFLHSVLQEKTCRLILDMAEEPLASPCVEVCTHIHSMLVAPILHGPERELAGAILLESPDRAAFGADDKNILESLAVYADTAIHSAKRYTEIQSNVRLREGLLSAGRGIAALQEPQKVLLSIAESVREALESDVVIVYTYDEEDQAVILPAIASGELRNPGKIAGLKYVSRGSVVGQLLSSGSPHFADNSPSDPLMGSGGFVVREGIQSSAAIPLKVGERSLGILFVNYRNPHSFTELEKSAILLFATQAAIAIHNARLFTERERKTNHLQAVYEAGKVITASVGLERKQILDRILFQAVESVTAVAGEKAVLGTIRLYDPETNELVLESAYPEQAYPDFHSRIGHRLPLDRQKAVDGKIGVTGRTALNRRPQIVRDVNQDPDYLSINPHTLSALAVPLLDGDRLVGVLNVEGARLDAFDGDDAEALQALAALAVVALNNAERYAEMEKTKDYLLASQAVAWLGLFGADWQHTINQKTFSIRNYADGLRRWLEKNDASIEVNTQVLDVMSRIEKVADSIREVQFTSQVPAEPGSPVFSRTQIDEALPDIVDRWASAREDVTTIYDLKCPGVMINILPQWLKVALEKLVNNALKAMPEGGQLTVSTRQVGGHVYIYIKDSGHGIPDEALPHFLKSAIYRAPGQPGTGMGTLIARFVALSHGGDLTLVSTQREVGTQLLLTLPVVNLAAGGQTDSGGGEE